MKCLEIVAPQQARQHAQALDDDQNTNAVEDIQARTGDETAGWNGSKR